jgi:hypothetical protein
MKRIPLLLSALFSFSCFAQPSQNLDSKVTNVTLFISGAQVTRTAQASLQPGIAELTFTGLSEGIDVNTIRLTGEGSFTIISVNSRINYLKAQKNIKDEESLNLKKKQLGMLLEDIASQQEVLDTEESLLKANQKIGSAEKGTVTAELKSAADFFRARFTELSEKKLALTRKDENTREELKRINDQLGMASQEEVKPTGEIIVQVMAKEPLVAKFKLSYLVKSASWKPEFDLRLDDISQPLELSRRAKISQNSGEEWKDIKLTLSTGNPNESGTEPRISTWYLGGYIYKSQSSGSNSGFMKDNAVIDKPFAGYSFNGHLTGSIYSLEDGNPLPGATVIVKGTTNGVITDLGGRYTLDTQNGSELVCSMIGMESVTTRIDNPVINIGMVSGSLNLEEVVVTSYGISNEDRQSGYAKSGYDKHQEVIQPKNLEIETGNQQQVRSVKEYTISMPMNMPSDGKQYNLVIGGETIKADYEFHAVPKFDRDAFLVAKVVNWQDYDLLDATAGIFYEGTFTGRTKLSASLATDTLDISLGRDKSIMIERKKVKDYTSNQLFGSNRTVQRGWEISLRNNKKQPVRLVVFDQYPVSRDKEIDVELSEDGGAQVSKESGLLRWEVTLEPGQLKKLKFRYAVKYPKELILSIE